MLAARVTISASRLSVSSASRMPACRCASVEEEGKPTRHCGGSDPRRSPQAIARAPRSPDSKPGRSNDSSGPGCATLWLVRNRELRVEAPGAEIRCRRQIERERVERVERFDGCGCGGARRRIVDRRRVAGFAATLMDFGETANGSQVVRRQIEHRLELRPGVVVPVELHQRTTERHAGGEVRRMMRQAGAARADRFLEAAHAPVFLGELRKGNRGRILLHPPAQLFDTRARCHFHQILRVSRAVTLIGVRAQ